MRKLHEMTNEELQQQLENLFEEIRERDFDFRTRVQRLCDYVCRNKSFTRIKVGVNEWAAFWRGARGTPR